MRGILALLLLVSSLAYADGPYTRSKVTTTTSGGGGGSTTPGGATTQVQYNNNGGFGADAGLTYVSATGTITSNFYGINNNLTSSNTEVLYTSGTVMDGAHGLAYDRINNQVFIGAPTGVAVPTPSATLHVSGTVWAGIISTTGVSVTGTVTATTHVAGLGTAAIAAYQLNAANNGFYASGATVRVTTAGDNTQFGASFNSMIKSLAIGGLINTQPLGALSVSGTTGIGNVVFTPSATLHVSGTLLSNGSVTFSGLSTGTPVSYVCLAAAGLVISNNAVCVVSAREVKDNIASLPYGLSEVMRLRPVTYTYKKSLVGAAQGLQVGLIADEVQGVVPELVVPGGSFNGKPILAVDYQKLTVVLVRAVQDMLMLLTSVVVLSVGLLIWRMYDWLNAKKK